MKKYKKILLITGILVFLLAGYASIKLHASDVFGMSESVGNFLSIIWLLITTTISIRWVYNVIYSK